MKVKDAAETAGKMTKEHEYLGHFKGCLNEGHNTNWIQGAIKHPGALTKKAHKAGESTMAYARKHEHDSGTTGRQARLAETLSHLKK